ncbi:hypothetical protein CUMW_049730 [Citrus unshiu]|nr:hypothetical protein CUMW_049730 [Citrus unshiu]
MDVSLTHGMAQPSQLLPSGVGVANLLKKVRGRLPSLNEITAEGRRITKLDQILLNGNNIAILVPGGSPDPE